MENEIKNIMDDDIFSIHVTSGMEVRNALRSGLLEAQRKESNKIPLFVSWPGWLEDGIVCMYAKDFCEYTKICIANTSKELENAISTEPPVSNDE